MVSVSDSWRSISGVDEGQFPETLNDCTHGIASYTTANVCDDRVKHDYDYDIHPWEQFVHTLRTQVTSLHHNVSAALAETFSASWRLTGESVWLLGQRYGADCSCSEDGQEGLSSRYHDGLNRELDGAACGSPDEFNAAWAQILRMTYREGFSPMYRCVRPPAAGSDEPRRYIRLTSDAGWGCMIRVGQMLLAAALRRHQEFQNKLPMACKSAPMHARRGAHGTGDVADTRSNFATGRPLERHFFDDPSPERCAFSIYEFVRAAHGQEVTGPGHSVDEGAGLANVALDDAIPCDKRLSRTDSGGCPADNASPRGALALAPRQLTRKLPGDWFGPTTISETIAALVKNIPDLDCSLAVYVDADGVLYEDEVRALAIGEEATPSCEEDEVLCGAPEALLGNASPGASCKSGRKDSDDEFMVVNTACVSSASAWSPLLTARADAIRNPDHFRPRSPDAESTVASVELVELEDASFMNLPAPAQATHTSLTDFYAFELPPAAIPAATKAPLPPAVHPAPASVETARSWNRAVLLLFPLQLGLERYVSESHIPALLSYFELPSSLGAMGGRPRMAHFFVGRQARSLLYVDPHIVQQAVVSSPCIGDVGDAGNGHGSEGISTFSNAPIVQTIPAEHIDSSISLAFYCSDEAELSRLLEGLRRIEATQVNALISTEQTRPEALKLSRDAVASRAPDVWCDIDGMGHSFADIPRCLDDDLADDVGEVLDAGSFSPQGPSASMMSRSFDMVEEESVVLPQQEKSFGRCMDVGAPWAVIEDPL